MTSNAGPGQSFGDGAVGVSGPTRSLWLRLLAMSSAAAGVALIITGVIAVIFHGPAGLLSSIFGGLLVMTFFGISLLIGHFVGKKNPSGAIGMFVVTYFVKIVCFALVLLLIGAPEWLHGRWFLGGAAIVVVVWQAAEIYGFSKARLLVFGDPEPEQGAQDV